MELQRGMRDKLDKYVNTMLDISVSMNINGNAVYDFCCFGVDANSKLSDDRYMVFFNQTSSPAGEVVYQPATNSANFNIKLSALPANICRLIFTVSIDGNGTMGDMASHSISVSQNGTQQITASVMGSAFKQEKAIISIEIYNKDGWRISNVSSGFNGGLSALLANYGGVELGANNASQPASQPVQQQPVQPMQQSVQPVQPVQQQPVQSVQSVQQQPASTDPEEAKLTNQIMGKISLSKDKVNLEKHVVNLSKTVVSLSKQNGVALGNMKARVVVALDYSGSMNKLYKDGTVQKTINKLLPLGLTFDDNGSVDVYLFQNTYMRLADLTLNNYEDYVQSVVRKSGYYMGGTYYEPVIKAILEGENPYNSGRMVFGGNQYAGPMVNNMIPTFILFITDGENSDKANSDNIIRKSSEMNVFIQFIGIGNEKFTYLRGLDDMPGRRRDNTGFSEMKDLNNVSDQELYANVLTQFSQWLKGAQ